MTILAFTLLLTLLSLAPLSHAETATDPIAHDSKWSFVIAPYAWLATTGGTITTDGVVQYFDLSFDDILDLTTGGFQLYTQARHKRFYISFDGTWATLCHGEDLLGGRIDFTVDQTIVEVRGGFRFLGPEFGVTNFAPGDMALDVYLSVHCWLTDISLNVNSPGRPPIIPTTQVSGSSSNEWVEPLIGGRFRLGLTPRIGVSINGNAGGFGVGRAADLTWTLTMTFDWRFAQRWDAAFGWRTQSVEDVSESGSERNGSKIVTKGPIVGLIYRF